jgi:hypothetical protein
VANAVGSGTRIDCALLGGDVHGGVVIRVDLWEGELELRYEGFTVVEEDAA